MTAGPPGASRCRAALSTLLLFFLYTGLDPAVSEPHRWHGASTSSPPPGIMSHPACSMTNLQGRDSYKIYAGCLANRSGLPAPFAHAVMEIESGFDPHAYGGDGEIGLMQILPSTAYMLGFRGTIAGLRNPVTNIDYGVSYLAGAYRLAQGDLCTTLMKYRAGHGETRFSVRSVDYCRRARNILSRDGIRYGGKLPEPTFGFDAPRMATGAGTAKAERACIRRSFVPGRNYGRCLQFGSGGHRSSMVAARRRMFMN